MKNTFSFLLALFAYTLISATLLLVSKGCVTTMEPTLWDFIKSVIMFAVVVYAVFTIITYLTNAMFVSAFKKTDYPKTLFWMLLPLHSVSTIYSSYKIFRISLHTCRNPICLVSIHSLQPYSQTPERSRYSKRKRPAERKSYYPLNQHANTQPHTK